MGPFRKYAAQNTDYHPSQSVQQYQHRKHNQSQMEGTMEAVGYSASPKQDTQSKGTSMDQ